MINEYVTHLIKNLPTNIDIPLEINLVLSGGAFNGSYMLGSLYYLKELENQKRIKIKKISGSSIGSVLGLLYFADRLDLFNEFYKTCFDDLNKNHNLSKLLQLKHMIKDRLPSNICDILKKRFYVSYHNIQLCEKHIKNTYNNTDELLDCIIRSCYIPFLVNHNPAYKNKYIDGMMPYFFRKNNRRVIYINLITHDKINGSLAIRNENTNLHRVLAGINDIHIFFIKKKNTYMCSYIDKWSIYEYVIYLICIMLEKSILYTMHITKELYNMKIIRTIIKEFTRFFITSVLSL